MDDLELFDLVEEVNKNFYEVLGLDQSASSGDIKRAYRKLSLQLHPDKNKEEDAEAKFRQLVSIYEVLKDENKRKKYHEVLENGLPDWRQPIYYYRRVRKMGLLELSVILSLIITVGQFITMWAIYAEKKYTLEENFESVRKKLEKKIRKNKGNEEEIDKLLEEELKALPKPKLTNLWQFQLVRFLVKFFRNLPENSKNFYEALKSWRERKDVNESDESDSEIDTYERKPRIKRTKVQAFPEASAIETCGDSPVVYGAAAMVSESSTEESTKQVKEGEWTDEDHALFAKAVNKFPGGTPKRWEKIAEMLGRSVSEVTAKAKTLKDTRVTNVSVSLQSNVLKSGKKSQVIADEIISKSEEDFMQNGNILEKGNTDGETVRKRNKKDPKTAERTLVISKVPVKSNTEKVLVSDQSVPSNTDKSEKTGVVVSDDSWNKNLQTIFEWALRQYPKGTEQRWDKIAEHIPGKSKEDCIQRFKYLAELVKKKKVDAASAKS